MSDFEALPVFVWGEGRSDRQGVRDLEDAAADIQHPHAVLMLLMKQVARMAR